MSDPLHVVLGGYPAATLAAAFLKANLVAALAIGVVAVARIAARRAFGPAAAYHLWGAPLAAALLTLLIEIVRPHGDPWVFGISGAVLAAFATLWALGAVAMAAVFAVAQARFQGEVRTGRAGPAVIGFISPLIVMPANDGRYTAEERELIRAHEREHVARKDPRAAVLAAVFQSLCWFNPLVHLAARLIRLDQELACDAAVVRGRPAARALYARTLLKTQLAATPLPFGCRWSPRGTHPLEVRIEQLKRRGDRRRVRSEGDGVVAAPVHAIRP
ncbi:MULTISPECIES: M56 family metallopeptidase [unclassified Phenylobacterium]|uniref:M56 family metallopeptidase n=1 Tax=unclassified Phenylobacterium TaxID=2640670 RepID=UPI00083B2976|nr:MULTISPECIES: M56 family metallopeptidase [unclassified Phenylobacterium]